MGYYLLMPGHRRACRAVFNLESMVLHLHVAARMFTATGTDEGGADIWPHQVLLANSLAPTSPAYFPILHKHTRHSCSQPDGGGDEFSLVLRQWGDEPDSPQALREKFFIPENNAYIFPAI